MTYEEATRFLKDCEGYGSVLGLDNMKLLLEGLFNPQKDLKFVHIAGTNGKGSTAAFITYCMAAAGYKVGRYISPAVFCYEEKFQIFEAGSDGNTESRKVSSVFITKEDITEEAGQIKEVCQNLTSEGKNHPTIFEVETALAMMYFRKKQCDLVVLEVGLGGRLDATNVIDTTECAVITSISMDHMTYLGNTLAEIAWEKAGIIKPGIPVVSYEQAEEASTVIKARAKELKVDLLIAEFNKIEISRQNLEGTTFSYGERKNLYIRLLGEHQVKNATLALLSLEVLIKKGYKITEQQIREGLYQTCWSGRLEPIAMHPLFLLDGAHNEDAAVNLAENIKQYFKGKRIYFIMGVFADKEYDAILKHTAHLAYKIYTLTPNNQRGLSSAALARAAVNYNKNVIDSVTSANAVWSALKAAKKEDIIIAFGSLSHLQEIREAVKNSEYLL
ncbi:bifunctional folylpolyglutamate synthase/dihydrofolate synthase [Anaerocolumna cellulosilytica]|uniref:tetrahydrofolate synthase n=1 Tax=Anaerocolumna cellulosilytica TaxID=433286 RepID=A0A6S6R6V2_9FIRM|nr:folylpolyglutamate synthase/dihydrofolate synthase family protein [Anaerocolumna cellulosilytica]MBB5196637.1 dihydrofolate synthase/folylpolyglutamate synthase [Anaerocolumna cellulosilytica]BCJ95737.1 bifunctional folylpolyglutamate synthase/dihydrofolate synthase [Anaerocolumna cellulosilytica]